MVEPNKGNFIDKFVKGTSGDAKFFMAAALAGHLMQRRKKRKQADAALADRSAKIAAWQKKVDQASLNYADQLDAFANRMDGKDE